MWAESKPRGATGQSIVESKLQRVVARQGETQEGGLSSKLKRRTTEFAHGVSKSFREHPVKASVMAAVMGVAGGLRVAHHSAGLKANWVK